MKIFENSLSCTSYEPCDPKIAKMITTFSLSTLGSFIACSTKNLRQTNGKPDGKSKSFLLSVLFNERVYSSLQIISWWRDSLWLFIVLCDLFALIQSRSHNNHSAQSGTLRLMCLTIPNSKKYSLWKLMRNFGSYGRGSLERGAW